ncbi:NYN domain-containing protein [Pacificimonas sp. WHA3]|uniref:NYN domain-containing protein n=1 Tax=Pacificimonas pallii TaxID=2827236 RepID=A0ABS6SDR8_9SPHN|nr:NYN domain-containing protein [Pacificimonas pallii]MBV7255992.1 NYN domain-containing protein [Pacificimonas pallii]
MTTDKAPSIALLIDADNASPNHLDPVLTVLAELGEVNVRRAYGNWRKPALKTWADLTLTYAIEPYQQFDIVKGKNATDMRIVIDAMDLMYGARIGGFGIMSSDSDFMPLAQRIRQEGIPVYGFGTERAPEAFRAACTRYIDVAALKREETADNGASAKPREKRAIDKALLDLLIDAYNSVKRDDDGWARLSEVGQRANNRSSFDARNYGYARLSDLMKDVPQFAVETDEDDNQQYVKRLR